MAVSDPGRAPEQRSVLMTIHFDLDPDKGAAGATLDLADALRRQGHAVDIVSLSDLPSSIPVQIRQLVLFPVLVAWRVIRARGKVDVLDASTGDAWLVPMLPSRWRPGVVIARSHGLEHVVLDALQRNGRASGVPRRTLRRARLKAALRLALVARTLRSADISCLLNDGDAEYARRRLRVAADRITVVRNALPAWLRTSPPPDGDRCGLVFIGEWNDRKGAGAAARIVNRMLAEHERMTVRFVGTRSTPEATLALITPSLWDRVEVVPAYRRADLPALLADRSILIFPSLQEGAPLAVLEAMAAGLAVVASDVPGPREMVAASNGGMVVPASDVEAFCDVIRVWLSDPERLMRIRRAAWSWGVAQDWEGVARELSDCCFRIRPGVAAAGCSRSPKKAST